MILENIFVISSFRKTESILTSSLENLKYNFHHIKIPLRFLSHPGGTDLFWNFLERLDKKNAIISSIIKIFQLVWRVNNFDYFHSKCTSIEASCQELDICRVAFYDKSLETNFYVYVIIMSCTRKVRVKCTVQISTRNTI